MREPVSFWQETVQVNLRHFTTSCEDCVVAKTSPRNVGNLVFLNHKRTYLSSLTAWPFFSENEINNL